MFEIQTSMLVVNSVNSVKVDFAYFINEYDTVIQKYSLLISLYTLPCLYV